MIVPCRCGMPLTGHECIPTGTTSMMCSGWHGHSMENVLPLQAKIKLCRCGMPLVEGIDTSTQVISIRCLQWPGLAIADSSPLLALMLPCRCGLHPRVCERFTIKKMKYLTKCKCNPYNCN